MYIYIYIYIYVYISYRVPGLIAIPLIKTCPNEKPRNPVQASGGSMIVLPQIAYRVPVNLLSFHLPTSR